MKSFSRFEKNKKPAVRLPKPLRIEKKMIHGQLVEVKIYARLGLENEAVTARARRVRSGTKCIG